MEEDYGDSLNPGLRLYISLFVDLEVDRRLLVEEWAEDNVAARGEMSREAMFWQAVAHYLNSGGEIEQAVQTLARAVVHGREVPDEALAAICPPDGFILLTTERLWYEEVDGNLERPQHLFVNPTTEQGLRWIEDVHWEITSMQELYDELYGEDEPLDGA